MTLVAWDHHTAVGDSKRMDDFYAAFMKKYPQVTIKRISKSYDENIKTQRLALSGNDSPDLVMTGSANTGLMALVEGGLVLPLDKYADAWDWHTGYSEGQLDQVTVTDDGKSLGSGHLYAVSDGVAFIATYYNKDKLTQLGAQYPQTIAEFEAICDKALAAGEVCIQHANDQQWPASNDIQVMGASFVAPSALRTWYLLDPTAKLPDGYRAAVERWQEWAKKGYFAQGFAGKAYDQGTKDFIAGEGVFYIDGTWVGSDVASMGAAAGFKLLPPLEAGGLPTAFAVLGDPWVISAKSKHPDVAAALLDLFQSQEGRQISVDYTFLPPKLDGLTFPADSLIEEQAAAFAAAAESNGLVPYLASVAPDTQTVWSDKTQELMAGRITAQEWIDAIEANRTTYIDSR